MKILKNLFPKTKPKHKTYLVLSDLHIPYHDQRCIDAICELCHDLPFDGLVINGDLVDFGEISRHNEGSVAKLEGKRVRKTVDACNVVLDQLMSALGKQCTDNSFLEGNHDDRIRRWLEKGDNITMKDYVPELKDALRLDTRGITFIEGYPKAKIRLGNLWVTHGIWTNDNHAKKHVDQFKSCVLFGHKHVPAMYYAPSMSGQVAGWCTGHLADANSKAMDYAPTPNAWTQGFAIVYVRPNGEFAVQQIQFWNHIFFYGGKQYGRN